MAAHGHNKQNLGQQNRKKQRLSGPREYGNMSYAQKRKAPQFLYAGNPEFKRVTRSNEQKSDQNIVKTPDRLQHERHPSKIPVPRVSPDHNSQSSTNSPHTQSGREGPSASSSAIDSLFEEYGLDSGDSPPNMDFILLHTLASMNKRLKKLDTLEEMNSGLKGEITRVQSLVGEVSEQVNTVKSDLKSDLKRCEDKWEASADGMMNRISKVEQDLQTAERKWESGNSELNDNLSAIQLNVGKNEAKISSIEAELVRYKEKWGSLLSLEQKIKDAAEDKFQEVGDSIKKDIRKEMVQEVRTVQASSDKESKYVRLKDQAFSKRHNLIIFGLAENVSIEEDRRAATSFFSERMNLSNITIQAVHRLGTVGNRPRPLVVRFPNIDDRWAVWNKKNKIKFVENQPVWVQQDLPKRLREDYRVLQRVAKVAGTFPEEYNDIKIKDYKISINGTRYGRDDLHLLPTELSPEMVYSPRSEEAVAFFTKHSPFSNHFHSPFYLEGIQFVCIEQYLAVQRAHLADDKDLARQAMGTSDPADHKVILNKLRPVHPEKWRERASSIIRDAVRAKFTQNHNLTKFLLDSYPLRIGEASKDSFWGIGLHLESPDLLDTSKWAPEGNLLGETLMSIRKELMKSQTTLPSVS